MFGRLAYQNRARQSDLVTSLPFGYRAGFRTVRESATDIAVGAGAARGVGDAGDIRIPATITKQYDAEWSVGDDAGGLANGVTAATNTWYHIYALGKSSSHSNNGDVGFDTSLTAANLLADADVIALDYDTYCYVGSFLSDPSVATNIVDYVQYGNQFIWVDPPTAYFGVNVSTSAVTTAIVGIPTGRSVTVELQMQFKENAARAIDKLIVMNPDMTAVSPSLSSTPYAQAGIITQDKVVHARFMVRTDTSSQVRFHATLLPDTSAMDRINFATMGWFSHELGRFT